MTTFNKQMYRKRTTDVTCLWQLTLRPLLRNQTQLGTLHRVPCYTIVLITCFEQIERYNQRYNITTTEFCCTFFYYYNTQKCSCLICSLPFVIHETPYKRMDTFQPFIENTSFVHYMPMQQVEFHSPPSICPEQCVVTMVSLVSWKFHLISVQPQ